MCENKYASSLSVNRRKYEGSAVGELVLWLALNPEHASPEQSFDYMGL